MQKEAKLGAEENTFFYDEERKMWRERGAAVPAAAAPLPPPPTAARQPGSVTATSGPYLQCSQQTLPFMRQPSGIESYQGPLLGGSIRHSGLLLIALLPNMFSCVMRVQALHPHLQRQGSLSRPNRAPRVPAPAM